MEKMYVSMGHGCPRPAKRKNTYDRSEKGDIVQLALITLQTKYQSKWKYTNQEIFDKN